MRVPFFRVAERKEPKKGRPHCLRPLRFATGQPVVLGFGGVSLELAPFHFAQTIASPDPPNPSTAGCPVASAQGSQTVGSPFLWFLSFGDAKERDSHAGRLPASTLNRGMQLHRHTSLRIKTLIQK